MATRYAGKYRRSPYPQATRMKNISLLTVLITGGDVLASPQDKFSFFAGGTTIFTGGDLSSPSSERRVVFNNSSDGRVV